MTTPFIVIKRDGTEELFNNEKIAQRLRKLKKSVSKFLQRPIKVSVLRLTNMTSKNSFNQIHTTEIDGLTADLSAPITEHSDYSVFAAAIRASDIQKNIKVAKHDDPELESKGGFYKSMKFCYDYIHYKTHLPNPLITPQLLELADRYHAEIEARLVHERDYLFDFAGMDALIKGKYLLHLHRKVVRNRVTVEDSVPFETPQYMYMRIALGIWGDNLANAFELYDGLSLHAFSVATPTMFNSGTPHGQLASCFLLPVKSDSIDGMYKTVWEAAMISKGCGGVGLSVSHLRSNGAYIQGSNGTSSGLLPYMKVLNYTAKHVDQGGKRKGSFAIYLEPWHPDLKKFLESRFIHGVEDERVRDLFTGLWVCDLFMKRLMKALQTKTVVMWSFFDPNECPGLMHVWGDEYEALYTKYENEGRYRDQWDITKLADLIVRAMAETGTPYILFKDHCNRKSNQKNLGTIRSSNLCVAGDTFVLTQEHGHVKIAQVVDQTVHVWNGEEWSETVVHQTSESSPLWQVSLSNFTDLYCTGYHKFFVQVDPEGPIEKMEAQNLQPGMQLAPYRLPDDVEDRKVTVMFVKPAGREEPTYCFTESKRNAGVFNNVLTGNCAEIIQYSSDQEMAVCNLGSMSLPYFYDRVERRFRFDELHRWTQVLTKALDRVIDINNYPLEEMRRSNLRHRPIGLGASGEGDLFCMMRLPYDSPAAVKLNRQIYEQLYFSAMTASVEEAKRVGPYPSMHENGGAPIAHGIFQFEMWKEDCARAREPDAWKPDAELNLGWEDLRAQILQYGVRNSELTAQMPTASTAAIMKNSEMFEPRFFHCYNRKTKHGEYVQISPYLMEVLEERNLLQEVQNPLTGQVYVPIIEQIKAVNGDVSKVPGIPHELFKSVFDIEKRIYLRMARDRALFITQSASQNAYFEASPLLNHDIIKYLCFAWNLGLKTAVYYTRKRNELEANHLAQKGSGTPTPAPASTDTECVGCSA